MRKENKHFIKWKISAMNVLDKNVYHLHQFFQYKRNKNQLIKQPTNDEHQKDQSGKFIF